MCTTLGECLIQEMQQIDGENPIQHSERALFSKSIPTQFPPVACILSMLLCILKVLINFDFEPF